MSRGRKNNQKKVKKDERGFVMTPHYRKKSMTVKHSARQRWTLAERRLRFEENKHLLFHTSVPETTCECCVENPKEDISLDMEFDENGYPLVKKNFHGSVINEKASHAGGTALTNKQSGISLGAGSIELNKPDEKPFRFLDLPAELRTYIYELALSNEKQIVCINDSRLRPSTDMPNPDDVLRTCKLDVTCVPCQLHDFLGTGSSSLSTVCKQIHSETALIPYKMNRFSLHNVYYLQAFLLLIGQPARKAMRHLRFDWRLPELDAHPLKTHVDLINVYALLLECEQLQTLWVDMDVVNLLSWDEDGEERAVMLTDLRQTGGMRYMFQLRGLSEIRVRWKHVEGLVMADWVKNVMGLWRLPRDSDMTGFEPVQAEVEFDGVEWCSVHWKQE